MTALWRGSIAGVRHARRRRRLPGPTRRRAGADPGAVRPRARRRCSRRSRRTAARRGSPSSPAASLVARAGWLVARVLHVRERGGRQVVLDAGMTELIRPALYGARHPIVALTSLGDAVTDAAAVAAARPDADPGRGADLRVDRCPRHHDLPPLRRGDLVAIADAGAYAASLGSTYNGRPRPPQVLLETDGTAPARPPSGHSRRARLTLGYAARM